MKKYGLLLTVLSVVLSLTITGCSKEDAASVLGDAIPEKITSVEVSGFYNGGELNPWELTQEEIEELNSWLPGLSLKHRTYAKGEAPNEVWNGGTSYRFNINDGELSFAWVYIDKAYIQYDGKWYEITNTSAPPLDLAGPGK